MFKSSPSSGGALYLLCDKCSKILHTYNGSPPNITWERVMSKRKDKGAGRGRELVFCDEKCRIVFLRGRKYYNDKLEHQKNNWEREIKRMDGN